jgi:16S rRNA (guanine527-N7)-methyltransferase
MLYKHISHFNAVYGLLWLLPLLYVPVHLAIFSYGMPPKLTAAPWLLAFFELNALFLFVFRQLHGENIENGAARLSTFHSMQSPGLLLSFAKENKLDLPENFMDKILEFCELLLEANKGTNLVSKKDSQKLLTRHVADSLVFAVYCLNRGLPINRANNWADIGSGAGFPVVPLCLCFKESKFFAIDSRRKRCEFLEAAKQKLNLRNLEVVLGKAESLNFRDMDIVSCRAVGSLEADFERAKMLLKKGGHFLTLKSKRIICEMQAHGSKLLNQAKIFDYKLPNEEMEYALAHITL